VRVLEDASADDTTKANAAGALARLARDDANRAVIMAAGALPQLVELLRDGRSAEGRRNAGRALCNLTFHDEGQRQVAGLGYTQDQLEGLLVGLI
jgi:hypothetical protein